MSDPITFPHERRGAVTLLFTTAFWLITIVHGSGPSLAQDTRRAPEYRAWMQTMDTSLVQRIQFEATADSGIWYHSYLGSNHGKPRFAERIQLPVTDLRLLQFRRRNSIGKAILVSTPLAIIVGTIAGRKPLENPNPNAAVLGIRTVQFTPLSFAIGAGACLTMGMVIGSARKNVRIEGRPSRYQRLRPALDGYAEGP